MKIMILGLYLLLLDTLLLILDEVSKGMINSILILSAIIMLIGFIIKDKQERSNHGSTNNR